MRDAGVPADQAEAIASLPEERLVTREYLDSRIDALDATIDKRLADLKNDLTWRILGIAGLLVVLVGLLDKFVRP